MEVKVLVGTRNPEAKRPGSINELNEIDGRRKCQTKYSEIEQLLLSRKRYYNFVKPPLSPIRGYKARFVNSAPKEELVYNFQYSSPAGFGDKVQYFFQPVAEVCFLPCVPFCFV